MEARRDVFQAVADPTRRRIIAMLARESSNVNAIADHFDLSRQAISLQIKILEECGFINIQQQGRERICHAEVEALSEISVWVDQCRQLMEIRLDALESYLVKLQRTKKHGKKGK